MAEVNVTQVDGDLFGFARSIAEPLNFSRHGNASILLDGIWMA
jgi:hypothetical protein